MNQLKALFQWNGEISNTTHWLLRGFYVCLFFGLWQYLGPTGIPKPWRVWEAWLDLVKQYNLIGELSGSAQTCLLAMGLTIVLTLILAYISRIFVTHWVEFYFFNLDPDLLPSEDCDDEFFDSDLFAHRIDGSDSGYSAAYVQLQSHLAPKRTRGDLVRRHLRHSVRGGGFDGTKFCHRLDDAHQY
jgi:hypothetical protein